MRIKGLKIHRITSWLLVLFAFLTVFLGYIASRRWFSPYDFYLILHLVFEWILISLTIIHIIYSRKYMKLKLRRIIAGLKSDRAYSISLLRLIQRITKWGIIILTVLVTLSGLIYYEWFALIFDDFFLFAWHINFEVILLIFIIIHVGVGSKFFLTRKRINRWSFDLIIAILIGSLIILSINVNLPPKPASYQVKIGDDKYKFDPNEVSTVRPDIFQNGSFSIFDALVYLNSTGQINLTSHFDDSMNTYVIDSLNGENDWWYYVSYSGGSGEQNAVRIDHYPWKPETVFKMYKEGASYINHVYSTFKEELIRLTENNGTVIIPTVIILGRTINLEFYNVSPTPHDMRNDTLQDNVITALDVIMTLGDLGYISYELKWVSSLGRASYVHSYFVERINSDQTIGRCGFIYEVGDLDFIYPGPNYIYMGADERVLNSPEYLRFFWACL